MDIVSTIIITVVIIVTVALIAYFVSVYNRFYALKDSATTTLGQVRVAMKKRLDMVEQLLGAVESYAKLGRETLERIVQLKSEIFNAGTEGLRSIDKESRGILGNVLAVAEAYPNLKTSNIVANLTESIKGMEDETASQRQTYNDTVQEFNIMADSIPSKFVGSLMGMTKMEYLQFEE